MAAKPVILLVEANADDVFMIRHTLEHAFFSHSLQVASDAEEALAYLKGDRKYRNRADYPLPSLILLALKLPKMDGFNLLRWIRRQSRFKSIRIVVLTDSVDIPAVKTAYDLGANSFLAKPADFKDGVRLMLVLAAQWLPAGTYRREASLPAASRGRRPSIPDKQNRAA